MSRRRKIVKIKRRHKPGSSPGLVVPHSVAGQSIMNVLAYGPDKCVEKAGATLAEVAELKGTFPVVWIEVEGLGNTDAIVALGQMFGLHRLALEDVVNTHQRPKADDYGDHLLLIARMLKQGASIETEQFSAFLGSGYLITFQPDVEDCFDPVRERIRQAKGRIRSSGADYLCYALIDSIIDAYFPLLEAYGELLEDLEDNVVKEPHPAHVGELHDMKRELLMFRRAVWPHREMLNGLIRDEHDLISPETRPFLRDCYDHTIQLMDIIETYREIASSLIDVYMSSVSIKMNEVMKTLTIVATIFMPLSFITGLYGMNFDRAASPLNMPELGWYYGYPFALLLMLVSAGGLVWYSWLKGWVFEGSRRK
ncbi:MAG: magnesium/cobalt transporter CorA [Alphaproteobacteria bacterium]|nr:magnesium/cobalt transporter CorA [Alphaproteobacteria bacterium]